METKLEEKKNTGTHGRLGKILTGIVKARKIVFFPPTKTALRVNWEGT